MTRSLRLLLLASALVLPSLLATGTANAGTYTVWSCRDGANQPAPLDGWSTFNSFIPVGAGPVGENCAAGGSMSAFFTGYDGAPFYTPMQNGWEFNAPADVTVAGATLDTAWGVSGALVGDRDAFVMVGISKNGRMTAAGFGDQGLVAGCRERVCNRDTASSDAFLVGGKKVGVTLSCLTTSGASTTDPSCIGGGQGRAHFYLMRAKLTLTDNEAPSAVDFGGTSLSGQPLSGTATLLYTATDRGAGIQQAEVLLDGQVIYPRQDVDGNGGACLEAVRVVGFRTPVPCKLRVPMGIPVDTTKVPDGTHTLTASVWDAAGNGTKILERPVVVRNAGTVSPTPTPAPTPTPTPTPTRAATPTPTPAATPGPGGSGADGGTGAGPGGLTPGPVGSVNGRGGDPATAHFATKKASRPKSRTVAYGRTLTLSDRLLDAKGKAIAGAAIDVIETRSDGPAKTVATAVTDAKGRVTHEVETTAPRLIEFAYARTVGSTSYVDRRAVKVKVVADVSLKLAPRTAARGRTVRFTGRVKAGTLPRGGVQVVLETKGPRGWLIGGIVSSDSAGNFSWSHAFRNAARYPFRARVLKAAGLEVAVGTSPIANLRVR